MFSTSFPLFSIIHIKFRPTLSSIQEEEKEMPKQSFTISNPKNNNWSVPIESNNQEIPNRLSFTPSACNWLDHEDDVYDENTNYDRHDTHCDCSLYNFHHNESRHYEEDTSFFPDVYGNIVRYGQVEPKYENFKSCMKCDLVQDNNILLQCCTNNHYLCTECFFQEKRFAQRQRVDYERQKRNGLNQNEIPVLNYQFMCPECNMEETLNFSVLHENLYSSTEDIEIIPAIKNYK